MSDLEDAVKPLIGSSISEGASALHEDKAQALISRWAFKTATAWDRYFRRENIPPALARYLHDHQQPPPNSYVWTGSFGFQPGVEDWRPVWGESRGLVLSGRKRRNGYAVTWNFGYLSFQVAGVVTDDEGFDAFRRADLRVPDGRVFRADQFTRQLWPMLGEPSKWPPPLGLDHAGMKLWSAQPPYFV